MNMNCAVKKCLQVGRPTSIMPSSSSVSTPVSLVLRWEETEEEAKDEVDPAMSGIVSRDSSSMPIAGDEVVEIVGSICLEAEARVTSFSRRRFWSESSCCFGCNFSERSRKVPSIWSRTRAVRVPTSATVRPVVDTGGSTKVVFSRLFGR